MLHAFMCYQVWSWGILAWQLLMREQSPYPESHDNMDVVVGLTSGMLDLRPSLPTDGSPRVLALAALARRCLDPAPERRPTMADLVVAMAAAAELAVRSHSRAPGTYEDV